MFEPRHKGNTLSTVTNPNPTSGTRVDVNTDELCTTIVSAHPIFFFNLIPNQTIFFILYLCIQVKYLNLRLKQYIQ